MTHIENLGPGVSVHRSRYGRRVQVVAGADPFLLQRPQLQVWQRVYPWVLVCLDLSACVAAATAAHYLGDDVTPLQQRAVDGVAAPVVLLPLLWVLAMLLMRTYEARFLGVGSEEYRRVSVAAVSVLAGVGTLSWALQLDIARSFVVVALPLSAVLTLLFRHAARKRLHRMRVVGRCTQRVLVAGHAAGVAAMVTTMRQASYHGLDVVAACVPHSADREQLGALQIPVEGGLDDIVEVVERVRVDVVAILACPELDGAALRRLGWALERTHADLLVAPAVTEVVGPRVAIRPVCGLPLLHLERPELTGVRRLGKSVVDRSVAFVGVVLLSPLLLLVTLAILVDGGRPVFFRQTRVGVRGRAFTMLKLRTMVQGADRQAAVLEAADDGNGVLFKLRADPRVTRVGRFLRRYSLDELPQLVNVLLGHMSLVGPRPPLQSEVDTYGPAMLRRLLVKPGMTGLWQISGRSDLDWDESVRIDVRYVENWSFAFDFMILWKTFSAVLRGRGAY